jgi:RNA polymerase sigma-B factor
LGVRRSGKYHLSKEEPEVYSDEAALHERFHRTRDEAVREQLVENYLPLARTLAQRYRQSSESMDDLFQVAALGLVKAIDRFDPERGRPFHAFAVPTILGELKRHFRDRVLPLHLPRGLKEQTLIVKRAAEELRSELDRAPTVAEVAERSDLEVEEALEALSALDASRTVSLDAPAGADEGLSQPVIEGVGANDPRLDRLDTALTVKGAMDVLDSRERDCVRLRFGADLTQEEIAGHVGVSQVHVSRILRRALEKLRAAVAEPDPQVLEKVA